MPKRLVSHHGAQVGAANANVNDVTNPFAGVPPPLAAAHAVGEVSHSIEYGVDLRNHVFAIYQDRGSFWSAQGNVQNSTVLGNVDLFAAKHGVDPPSQTRFFGELKEQLKGFIRNAILRVVQEEIDRLSRHSLAPARI